MKNKLYLLLLCAVMPCLMYAQAQNYAFNRVADCPEVAFNPYTFTIGDSLYVISGLIGNATQPIKTLTQHVWLYNTVNNTWTQLSDFPGEATYAGSGFVINGMGYVVNGWDSTALGTGPANLWRYNPQTDVWTNMAPFPGTTRYTTGTFVVNNKAYVCMGYTPINNNVWQYDPATNAWTQMSDFPGSARQTPVSFVINNVAYMGLGAVDIPGGYYLPSDFYKYNDTTDTWTQLNLFPGGPFITYQKTVIGNEAFMVCGADENSLNYGKSSESPNVWEYQPATDSWTWWGLFPDTSFSAGVSGTASGQGYMGLGINNAVTYAFIHKFWRFGPGIGATNCNATISVGFINNATRNFVASGNFSSTAVLSWNFGDGGTATGVSVTHPYDSAGTYTVVLNVTDTANGGCSATDTAIVTITSISVCSVTLSSTNFNANYTLMANPTGIPPYTYLWTNASGIPVSTSPDPLIYLPAGDTATFCLTITDSTGCEASDCRQYTGGPDTSSECQTYLYIYPQGSIPGLYYVYVYHTGTAPVISYTWSFGDGVLDSIPGDSLINYNYSNFGFFDVCLSVLDSDGCTSSFCDSAFYAYKVGGGPMNHLVQVASPPSAVSGISNINDQLWLSAYPNPANDKLTIVTDKQIDYMAVYTTLGQRIKQQEAPTNNTIDISQLAAGVYFVDVHIGNNNGRVKFIKVN